MGMVMSSLIILINLQSSDSGCYFSCLEVLSSCRTSVDFVLFDALCNTSSVPPFAFFTLTVSFLCRTSTGLGKSTEHAMI